MVSVSLQTVVVGGPGGGVVVLGGVVISTQVPLYIVSLSLQEVVDAVVDGVLLTPVVDFGTQDPFCRTSVLAQP